MSSLFVNQHGAAERGIAGRGMGRITIFLISGAVLVLLGGGLFLAYWNIPAPSAPFEKVLPDARFPK